MAKLLRNIITVTGTEVSPSLLLISKLLVVSILFSGMVVINLWGTVFLSFFTPLDTIFAGISTRPIWLFFFSLASLFLLLNYYIRVCLVVLSLLLVTGLLFSQPLFSNNSFFCAAIFLLCALSRKTDGTRLIVIQLAIMYFGALVDKLFFLDWRDGSFYEAFHGNAFYFRKLREMLPSVNVAFIMSWTSIIIEATIFVMLLFRKTRNYAALLGLIFHLSTAVLGTTLYAMFIPALLVSYIALLPEYTTLKLTIGPGDEKLKHFCKGYVSEISLKESFCLQFGSYRFSGINGKLMLFFLSPQYLMLFFAMLNLFVVPVALRIFFMIINVGWIGGTLIKADVFPRKSHSKASSIL